MESPPRRSTRAELAGVVAEAAVGILPVVGGPAGVALAYAIGVPFQRRMDAWLDDLTESVNEISAKVEGFRIETLVDDDRFVDAVITATRSAQRTHQRGKLNALRNAVLNSTLPGAPDTDMQMIFFRWIDDFTVGHLQLLTLLNDPRKWYGQRGLPTAEADAPRSIREMITTGMPAFEDDYEFVDVLIRDLLAAGLVHPLLDSVDVSIAGTQTLNQVTNGLGERFIAFITDPRR